MKKLLRYSMCLLGMLVLGSCPLDRVLPGASPTEAAGLPPDEMLDQQRQADSDFAFETLLPVDVKIVVRPYQRIVQGMLSKQWTLLEPGAADAFLLVSDDRGTPVYAGKILANGTLETRFMLPAAPMNLTFTLNATGFGERSFVVENASAWATIDRVVSLAAIEAGLWNVVLPDRDGDTVPDVYDAFPDDPESAFAVNVPFDGPLTIAFEDLFGNAQAGDADYNDFIAAYRITEHLNGQDNAIVRIEGTATSIAKIAGYNHDFLIAVDSFTGGADLAITYPTRTVHTRVQSPAIIPVFMSTRDTLGKVVTFSLHFDQAQPRASMDDAPYNPFLHVRNTGYDIHLIGEEALPGSRSAGLSFQDAEGFPWALLVPSTWEHPAERERIEVPYPRFTLWRQSFGAEHTDWYLHKGDPYVPTRYVYTTGYFESGSRDVAALWEDDLSNADPSTLVKLFETANARALAVYVVGTDVYAAGYITNAAGNETACYWKNGTRTDLFSDLSGIGSARANAITVGGADVYVAGYIQSPGRKAGYWKNGTWVTLHDVTTAEAIDIAVSGADVYATGYVMSGGKENACFWKNGTRTSLYTTDYSRGHAIAVSGADVYVAGYYLESLVLKACYWKNGTLVTLASGGAQARDVVVSGTDVYVAGYYSNASAKSVACYWKNGAVVNLYNDPVNQGRAHGIWVDGNDVYVAGYVNEGSPNACYWNNGDRVTLAADSSTAFAIMVAE